MIKSGKLRGETYSLNKDKTGCVVWYPLGRNEDVGMCFDFDYDDIDDFIALLEKIKKAKETK